MQVPNQGKDFQGAFEKGIARLQFPGHTMARIFRSS